MTPRECMQMTLPLGTPEECREEVVRLIEECGTDRGLVLRPSNMIGYDVPIRNIMAWHETDRDYRFS